MLLIGNLNFGTQADTIITILNIVFGVLIFTLVDVIAFMLLRKWSIRVTLVLAEICCLLGWMFNIYLLMLVAGLVWIGLLVLLAFVNLGDIRTFLKGGKHRLLGALIKKGKDNEVKGEQLFDRDEMYQKVVSAVVNLSRNKIGALITFERHDDLSDQMKTGSMLNAPVTPELLQTIFYPGTRLHDGAVIIRDDKIAAASVYFRPTTRPLTGKFGSRHRAAYGISESTDSVTILVSEETGRISIGFQGELTPVTPDNLLRILKEDMEAKVESAEE